MKSVVLASGMISLSLLVSAFGPRLLPPTGSALAAPGLMPRAQNLSAACGYGVWVGSKYWDTWITAFRSDVLDSLEADGKYLVDIQLELSQANEAVILYTYGGC